MVDLVFAVVGCLHGELDQLYESLKRAEAEKNVKIDIVICCGDFQSVRNQEDLESMAVPKKFRKMHDFHKYYDGSKIAPYLTIFIGGNHEASNYLWTLPYGGWVAKNIFYMGLSNVIEFSGIRICGIGGIFKPYNFNKGHYEHPPFDDNLIRSIYHLRSFDFEKLKKISNVDIMVSHDWPNGIWKHGNLKKLLFKKPFFKNDIQNNEFGCRSLMELIFSIKPKFYFCAHMHVDFKALVKHENSETKFLALDKSLPRRHYYEIFTVKSEVDNKALFYIPEWLAITKLYSPFFKKSAFDIPEIPPPDSEYVSEVSGNFSSLEIPPYISESMRDSKDSESYENEDQTVIFCKKLGIDNPCIIVDDSHLEEITNEVSNTEQIA